MSKTTIVKYEMKNCRDCERTDELLAELGVPKDRIERQTAGKETLEGKRVWGEIFALAGKYVVPILVLPTGETLVYPAKDSGLPEARWEFWRRQVSDGILALAGED